MTLEIAHTLWKTAAVAMLIAILVPIGMRDSAYALIAFAVVFVGFSLRQ
jgi:hypothetical protein